MKNQRLIISMVSEKSVNDMRATKAGSPTILTPLIPIACTAVAACFSALIMTIHESIHADYERRT